MGPLSIFNITKMKEKLTPKASAVSGCVVWPPVSTPEIEGVRAAVTERLPVGPQGPMAHVMNSDPFSTQPQKVETPKEGQ